MIYCQAVLPKAGLGNRLFPWARCRVFAFENKTPMLAPTWTQLAVGPLLRGETDLRHYSGLFVTGANDVVGAKKILVKAISRRAGEAEDSASLNENGRPVLKVFSGEGDRFLKLNGWHDYLRNELRAITKSKWIEAVDQVGDFSIGMHVRMGDFVDANAQTDNPHRRVPHSWFAHSLKAVRRIIGRPVRAVIVSDGKDSELRELLELENVSLVRTGSAIGDLMLLSNSKVLLASAGSSFSAWAAFLGQMPSIAHPSQSFDWFNLASNGSYLGGADPAALPEVFVHQVEEVLAGR
jgi:glycosyl transferase family 11